MHHSTKTETAKTSVLTKIRTAFTNSCPSSSACLVWLVMLESLFQTSHPHPPIAFIRWEPFRWIREPVIWNMCVGGRAGGNCDVDSASSRAGNSHMAADRGMRGQKMTTKERWGGAWKKDCRATKTGNPVKMSAYAFPSYARHTPIWHFCWLIH